MQRAAIIMIWMVILFGLPVVSYLEKRETAYIDYIEPHYYGRKDRFRDTYYGAKLLGSQQTVSAPSGSSTRLPTVRSGFQQ